MIFINKLGERSLKQFFSKYMHWLLVMFVGVGLASSLIRSTFSALNISALVFGIIGLIAVIYLAFHIEFRVRKENKESN